VGRRPLADIARKRNARYAAQVETDIARHVVPRFPLVSEITREAWNKAQLEMQDEARPLSLRTCQRVTVSLRRFLRYCEDVKAIEKLPALQTASGEDVAVTQAERRAFTRGERDRFLTAMRKLDARAHRIYTTLLYTALRKSGLERLLVRWIDRRTSYLTLPARAQKRGKGSRSFYLHPKARAAIWAEKMARGQLGPDEPLFGPFDFDDHRKGLFWRAVRAAKIPEHGLTAHHVTRHTACTIAGNEGATFAELMALGGWTTPAMAMRYFHADAKLSRGAVEKL
jgi:integrase